MMYGGIYQHTRVVLYLYNFLSDNDLCVGNFSFTQAVDYTYHRGTAMSYIDHVVCPCYFVDYLTKCEILHDEPDKLSDHLALSTTLELLLLVQRSDDLSISQNTYDVKSFPRTYWNNQTFCDFVQL